MKKLLLLLSFSLTLLLWPTNAIAETTSTACQKIGANSAAPFAQGDQFYQHSQDLGFGWTLEIATYAEIVNQGNPTVQGINRAHAAHLTPVVRIGVGDSSGGFIDPKKYALFLNKVADQVDFPFYAIAGPNEPEHEHWIAQEVGDDYTSGEPNNPNTASIAKAGRYLANYMNALLDEPLDSKIKLLSPSYTLTSWASDYFIDATIQAGGRFNELDGFSGTSYSGQMGTEDMVTHINKVTQRFPNLPIVFTEYHDGDGNADLTTLKADVDLIRTDPRAAKVIGALIFNVFNTNTDWSQFALDDNQLALVLPAECIANIRKITTVRPSPRPILRPCTTEDNPEFHPLRPYPGEPCDPLIPRSQPAANYPTDSHGLAPSIPTGEDSFGSQLAKDSELRNRVVFACGNSLDPNTPEQFDEASGRPFDPGDRGRCTLNGSKVTCWLRENFDLTLDLTNANIPVLGNTQTRGLTDAQQMTSYLSWYLNGTVQQSEQEPNPSINRLVNFSGPLQKLLAFDLKNAVRSWLVEGPAGEKFQPPDSGGQYHNYIVGCNQIINIDLTDYAEAVKQIVSAVVGNLVSAVQIGVKIIAVGKDAAVPLGTALIKSAVLLPDKDAAISAFVDSFFTFVSDPDIQNKALDAATFILDQGSDMAQRIGIALSSIAQIAPNQAVSCVKANIATPTERLKDFRGNDIFGYPKLPPDPTKEPDFATYHRKLLQWYGYTFLGIGNFGIYVPPLNTNVWAQLFQSIPFSSLEDTTGEVVISVIPDTHANQQDKDVVDAQNDAKSIPSAINRGDATLKLIIKPKP